MNARILPLGLLVLLSMPAAAPAAGSADKPLAATDDGEARFFPDSVVFYAELADPAKLVALLWDHPLRTKIASLPPYTAATETADFRQFQARKDFLETHFGMPWREAVERFAGKGIRTAVDAEQQAVAVLVRGRDAESMQLLRDKLITLPRRNPEALKQTQYRGIPAYGLGAIEFAIHEDRLLVTNENAFGRQILDRLIDQPTSGLAGHEHFRSARRSSSEGCTAWVYLDVERVRDLNLGSAVFQNRIDNPVAELLVGGIQSVLNKTPHLSADLSVASSGVALRFSAPYRADWVPAEREYYFGPAGNGRGPVMPKDDETLFTLGTYRDLSEMWLRAGDLFGQATNDKLAKADSNLTTLFAGRDFGQDILGSLKPQWGAVAKRQDFEEMSPQPAIRLPAFALALQMREPEKMSREFRRIFQSLVGFLNVVGAMQGRHQLELATETLDGGGELVSSSVVPEEGEDDSSPAALIYNFSPSIAYRGSQLVISSTKKLARELVLASRETSGTTEENTAASLHAAVLGRVLQDNREQLIAQNMLEEGNSRREAEAAIDLVLQLVGYFDSASLRLGTHGDQLDLELNVALEQ